MKDAGIGRAILFSQMAPEASFEEQFRVWCDEEYFASRLKCPGFVSSQSYGADAAESFLSVVEMNNLDALKTPEYQLVKERPSELTRSMLKNVRGFTCYVGEETYRNEPENPDAADSPLLFAVWWRVPTERAQEFGQWYEQEHIPMLTTCPDWQLVRRFHVTEGEPETWTHLALHYLGSRAALQSPEREAARKTVWRNKLAAEPWFEATYSMFTRNRPRQFASEV